MSHIFSGSRAKFRSAIVLACLLGIGIAGCTGPNDLPSQSTSTVPSAETIAPDILSPSPTAPTGEGDDSDVADSPTEEPVESQSPDDADSPQDGPTVAPVLPVVEGSLDEEITLTTDFAVSLSSLTAITVEAETPGDVAGPAVEVVVQVTNNSRELQSVSSAVVSLETTDGDLGIPTIAGGAEPLYGDLGPEESVGGRYIFMLDPVQDREVIINVNYAAGEPVAEFSGVIS